MSAPCPPGWRSTHGPQLWLGAHGGHSLGLILDWGGHQVWGAASGLGPPHPTAPPQGRVQQLLLHRPHIADSWSPPCP